MPVGLITDCLSVLLGGLAGAAVGKRIPAQMSANITVILGFSAMTIGVNSIVKAASMTAVVIAVIAGTFIGEALQLEKRVTAVFDKALRIMPISSKTFELERFVTVGVLFCASGFAIYGVLTEAMSGDASVLLSKAALDFCTAAVFAVTLGAVVSVVVLPMSIILGGLFLLAGFLAPFVTPVMLKDFMACGGVLTLAAGLRVSGIKNTPITNMVPALLIVFPISAFCTAVLG